MKGIKGAYKNAVMYKFAKIHGGTFILPERYIKVDVGEEYTFLKRKVG